MSRERPDVNSVSLSLSFLAPTVTQHIRALVAMKKERIESLITSMLELKLDQVTMFEWQRHSQDSKDVLPNSDLLEFLDLKVQASKTPFTTQTSDDHVQL